MHVSSGILRNRAENVLCNTAENCSPPLCGELFSALMRRTVLRHYAENCSPPFAENSCKRSDSPRGRVTSAITEILQVIDHELNNLNETQ